MMNKDSGSPATDANQIRARIEEVRMRLQFEIETLRDTVEPLLQAIREVIACHSGPSIASDVG